MEANGSLEAVGFRNMIVRKRKGWKRYGQCKREYDRRKPSWMNYMHRRNRQGGKPYNT